MKKLNNKQIKEILDLYIQGKKVTEIANQYDISKASIDYYRKKYHVRAHPYGFHSKKYDINDNAFKNINSEIEAYLLGFIFADGRVTKYYLRLDISEKDKYVLDLLRDYIYPEKHPEYIERILNGKKYLLLCVSNKQICDNIRKFQSNPSKEQFPFLSPEMLPHFIRGIFDGDGSFTFYQKKMRPFLFFLGKEKFLKEMQNHLIKTTGIRRTKLIPLLGIHRLSISSIKDIYFCANYLYETATIYLTRKHEKYIDFLSKCDIIKSKARKIHTKRHKNYEKTC
jgi:hypothetical protein